MTYTDFHTHLKRSGKYVGSSVRAIYSVDPTTESVPTDVAVSVGYHPLFLKEEGCVEEQISRLETLLDTHTNIVALGEIGWDKRLSLPMEEQDVWVKAQVNLAQRYRLPVFFHVVGAWHLLLALQKEHKGPDGVPFIVHGFRGKEELLQQLLSAGIAVSLSRLPQDQDSLKLLSEHPFLLETDDTDLDVREVYKTFADAFGWSLEGLSQHIQESCREIFGGNPPKNF